MKSLSELGAALHSIVDSDTGSSPPHAEQQSLSPALELPSALKRPREGDDDPGATKEQRLGESSNDLRSARPTQLASLSTDSPRDDEGTEVAEQLLRAHGYSGPWPRVGADMGGNPIVMFPRQFRDLLSDDATRDAALTYAKGMMAVDIGDDDDEERSIEVRFAIVDALLRLDAFQPDVRPVVEESESAERLAAIVPGIFLMRQNQLRYGGRERQESIQQEIRQRVRQKCRSLSDTTIERALNAWLEINDCSSTLQRAISDLALPA